MVQLCWGSTWFACCFATFSFVKSVMFLWHLNFPLPNTCSGLVFWLGFLGPRGSLIVFGRIRVCCPSLVFGSLGYEMDELEFVCSLPDGQSILQHICLHLLPKSPKCCRQKRPAPLRNLGFLPKKWTKTMMLCSRIVSLPFRSMDISCLFDATSIHHWWIWRFYWLERQVCQVGARSNTRAWLYLGTAAVLKRLGGGNSNIFYFQP